MTACGDVELADWTRFCGLPSATAVLRKRIDDFVVAERLGFTPSGDGEHEFVFVEKTDLTTPRAAELLARHAGVSPRAVSYSGMKDRRARTRQWFSVHRPGRGALDWRLPGEAGLTVLESTRNDRKLRRGTHAGNAFRLVLRSLTDPENSLPDRIGRLRTRGAPNYFGEQRFGRGGGNVLLARRLFDGGRLPRQQRSMALSAARSLIFNDLLSLRVRDGSWDRLRRGDLANLDGSRSVFAVEQLDAELEARCREFDLHPTGPLWGRGAPAASGEIHALERAAASSYPELRAGLEREARSSRRPLRMRLSDLDFRLDGDTLVLEFTLPVGSFATAVVRELVHAES